MNSVIVGFVVASLEHSPKELSNVLGLTPDEERWKGARMRPNWPAAPKHEWAIVEQRETTEPTEVLSLIEAAKTQLLGRIQALAPELQKVKNTEVKFWIGGTWRDHHMGVLITSSELKLLASVGAAVELDCYLVGEGAQPDADG